MSVLPKGCSETTVSFADARRGSKMLRDAILKAKGIVPQAPAFDEVARARVSRRGFAKAGFRKVRLSHPKIAQIQALIAIHAGLTLEEMVGRRKHNRIAHPRQIAMYLARRTTGASFPDIAFQFGGKDHTTVLHACQITAKRIAEGHEETILALHAVHRVIGA